MNGWGGGRCMALAVFYVNPPPSSFPFVFSQPDGGPRLGIVSVFVRDRRRPSFSRCEDNRSLSRRDFK